MNMFFIILVFGYEHVYILGTSNFTIRHRRLVHLSILASTNIHSSKAISTSQTTSCSTSVFEVVGNLLLAIPQNLHQVASNVRIFSRVKERGRPSSVADASSSANSMNVFIDAMWQVIIDNVSHTLDIQTTSCHRSGNQNGHPSSFKIT